MSKRTTVIIAAVTLISASVGTVYGLRWLTNSRAFANQSTLSSSTISPTNTASSHHTQTAKFTITTKHSNKNDLTFVAKPLIPTTTPTAPDKPTQPMKSAPARKNPAAPATTTQPPQAAKAAKATTPKVSTKPQPSPEDSLLDRMFTTVNKERHARGLSNVERVAQINSSSTNQSSYNASIDKLSHDGGLDRLNKTYYPNCGVSGEIIELVPVSYNEQQNINVWIDSPPHNKIMFSKNYSKAGIGLTKNKKNDMYYIVMQFCS